MTDRDSDRDQPIHIQYRGTGFYVSLVVAIIVAAALLVFAVQNTATVTIEWLVFEFSAPMFAWILGTALLAVILDEIIGLIWRSRKRSHLNRERRATEAREQGETDAMVPADTEPDEERPEDSHTAE